MADPSNFEIDLDELDGVISDLERTERRLETLTHDIERQILALHESWEGLSAIAQKEAQAEWNQGMEAMRTALADLRAASRMAHTNYSAAAEDNLKMWQQVT